MDRVRRNPPRTRRTCRCRTSTKLGQLPERRPRHDPARLGHGVAEPSMEVDHEVRRPARSAAAASSRRRPATARAASGRGRGNPPRAPRAPGPGGPRPHPDDDRLEVLGPTSAGGRCTSGPGEGRGGATGLLLVCHTPREVDRPGGAPGRSPRSKTPAPMKPTRRASTVTWCPNVAGGLDVAGSSSQSRAVVVVLGDERTGERGRGGPPPSRGSRTRPSPSTALPPSAVSPVLHVHLVRGAATATRRGRPPGVPQARVLGVEQDTQGRARRGDEPEMAGRIERRLRAIVTGWPARSPLPQTSAVRRRPASSWISPARKLERKTRRAERHARRSRCRCSRSRRASTEPGGLVRPSRSDRRRRSPPWRHPCPMQPRDSPHGCGSSRRGRRRAIRSHLDRREPEVGAAWMPRADRVERPLGDADDVLPAIRRGLPGARGCPARASAVSSAA